MWPLRIALVIAALSSWPAGRASAGAWTRAPDEVFTAQSVRYFTTELAEDTDAPFRRVSTDVYLEYGLREGLTLGGKLEFGQRLDGQQESFVSGFVRARLWRGAAGDVVSAQLGGGLPVLEALAPENITRDVTADARATLSYGRGFVSDLGAGWLDGAVTLRHRSGPPADELKLDLTAGLRPDEAWVTLAQGFATFGLGNDGFGGSDFDVVKLALSVGYRVTETRTLLLAVTQDVHGRNVSLGTEVAVTIWSLF